MPRRGAASWWRRHDHRDGQRRRSGIRGDRIRRTGAADQPGARRRVPAACRTGTGRGPPADPLPQAGLGWAARTTGGPVSVADHAADAAALLDHLGVARAHIAGHSSGAAVARPAGARRARPVAHAAPAGALAVLGAQRRGLPRRGRPRRSRPTRAATTRRARHVHERGERARLGDVPSRCSTSASPARWHRRSRTPTPSSASSCPRLPSGRSDPSRQPPSTGPCCRCWAARPQPAVGRGRRVPAHLDPRRRGAAPSTASAISCTSSSPSPSPTAWPSSWCGTR